MKIIILFFFKFLGFNIGENHLINNPRCADFTVQYSTNGQLSYLGEILVLGH